MCTAMLSIIGFGNLEELFSGGHGGAPCNPSALEVEEESPRGQCHPQFLSECKCTGYMVHCMTERDKTESREKELHTHLPHAVFPQGMTKKDVPKGTSMAHTNPKALWSHGLEWRL